MVSTYPSEKYELVNGKDDILYMKWENSKFMFETTNQIYIYIYIYILLKITIFGSQSGIIISCGKHTPVFCSENSIPSPKDSRGGDPKIKPRKVTAEALITVQREGVSQCLSQKKIAFLFRGISTETPLPALCSLVLEEFKARDLTQPEYARVIPYKSPLATGDPREIN